MWFLLFLYLSHGPYPIFWTSNFYKKFSRLSTQLLNRTKPSNLLQLLCGWRHAPGLRKMLSEVRLRLSTRKYHRSKVYYDETTVFSKCSLSARNLIAIPCRTSNKLTSTVKSGLLNRRFQQVLLEMCTDFIDVRLKSDLVGYLHNYGSWTYMPVHVWMSSAIYWYKIIDNK